MAVIVTSKTGNNIGRSKRSVGATALSSGLFSSVSKLAETVSFFRQVAALDETGTENGNSNGKWTGK